MTQQPTSTMTHLQPWYDRWLKEYEGSDLYYANVDAHKRPRLHQVHFVRDHLAQIVWMDVPHESRPTATPRDDCRETAIVVGEHHSKSVRLPVYAIERPDLGLRLVLRDNHYDWNVSIEWERGVDARVVEGFPVDYWDDQRDRFPSGYEPGRSWNYCHFQGFPLDAQHGPYAENPRRFSTYVQNDYQLYALVWGLMRNVRGGSR